MQSAKADEPLSDVDGWRRKINGKDHECVSSIDDQTDTRRDGETDSTSFERSPRNSRARIDPHE